jgi:hypothetical protein
MRTLTLDAVTTTVDLDGGRESKVRTELAPCAARRRLTTVSRPARNRCAGAPLRAVIRENLEMARAEGWVYAGLGLAAVGGFALACWQTGAFMAALPAMRHVLGLLAG